MNKTARPVSAATRALLDEMRSDASPPKDKLDQLRAGVAALREMEIEKAEKEARVSELAANIRTMKEKTLVDLFDSARLNTVGIEASGNMPAYTCEMGDYYHANIPDEHAAEAFAHLQKIGQADLIKSVFTISFGLKESKAAEHFQRSLDKAGIDYSLKQGVPWNTLTAWLKVEHKRKPLSVRAMEILGATVGRVVKVVKQKEKR